MFFSGKTLLAVKWRRFKVFFTGDDPAPRDRAWRRLWAPLVYNVEQDPREEVDVAMDNLWLLQPVGRMLFTFLYGVSQEGLIVPGGEEPEDADVEVPFQSPEEIERSLSALRWQAIRDRVQDFLPFGEN